VKAMLMRFLSERTATEAILPHDKRFEYNPHTRDRALSCIFPGTLVIKCERIHIKD